MQSRGFYLSNRVFSLVTALSPLNLNTLLEWFEATPWRPCGTEWIQISPGDDAPASSPFGKIQRRLRQIVLWSLNRRTLVQIKQTLPTELHTRELGQIGLNLHPCPLPGETAFPEQASLAT